MGVSAAVISIVCAYQNSKDSQLVNTLVQSVRTILVCMHAGFLCGRCPDGKGIDLTLRQCKDCTAGDAVVVALVCKLTIRVDK